MRKERWKAYEWQRVKDLLERGYRIAAVAAMVGRTADEISSKKQWESMSEERKQQRRDRINANRQRYTEQQRTGHLRGAVSLTHRASPEALWLRDIRMSAPQTLTGLICGDPRIGFSALDKKRMGISDPRHIDKRLEQERPKPTLFWGDKKYTELKSDFSLLREDACA